MAETITITAEAIKTPKYLFSQIIKVTIAWEGAAAGGAVTTTAFPTAAQKSLPGRSCVLATTNPGAVAPTAAYDIEILDALGVDIFGGALNNRSATANEQSQPLIGTSFYGPRLVADQLSFKLTGNSVNSATGECVLYFEF